jgi:hypothetical protein
VAGVIIELYKQPGAYDNAYSERRLDRLGTLWTATDRHGAEVLKLVSGDKVQQEELVALGETYYRDLTSGGLFLGEERITSIRSRVGDIFLTDHDAALRASSDATRVEAIRKFRANWLEVLRELEKLGEKHGK